ncbi:MAG: hypothetical protein K2H96_07430 [Muribaculaceae bacterium]|nr:hypothetical protein [Muribaculaceae bacterium]
MGSEIVSSEGAGTTLAVTDTITSFSLDSATVSNYNRFAYGFLARANEETKEDNVLVSPLSLEMLLSLLANGADSAGQEEILRYLNLSSLDALNDMNRRWMWLCGHTGERNELSLSNSIWTSAVLTVNEKYKEKMQKDYYATFHPLPDDPRTAMKEINLWADENTKGLIPEFLKYPLPMSTKFTLYNASYFKGEWEMSFSKTSTHMAPFMTPKGVILAETMKAILFYKSVSYYSCDKYQVIDLNYKGKIFNMRIIMPRKGYAVEDLLPIIARTPIKTEKDCAKVWLPKFRIRHSMDDLKNILKSSGLNHIFSNPRCFLLLTSYAGILRDMEMLQESVIGCDEDGSDAVRVGDNLWVFGEVTPIPVKIDRPFIFSIMENKTGAVMFTGIVRDPTK